MASIELAPLTAHFDNSEVEALEAALSEAGSSPLDVDDEADSRLVARDVDEVLLADLLDQLDTNEAACDVYVPPDFEDRLTIGDWKVGSAHALLLALEEIGEELGIGTEDEDEVSEDDPDADAEYEDAPMDEVGGEALEMREDQMCFIWKLMEAGARSAIREGLCMFVST